MTAGCPLQTVAPESILTLEYRSTGDVSLSAYTNEPCNIYAFTPDGLAKYQADGSTGGALYASRNNTHHSVRLKHERIAGLRPWFLVIDNPYKHELRALLVPGSG
jgi:hypothetical protein